MLTAAETKLAAAIVDALADPEGIKSLNAGCVKV
jgi:hypothetical protein